MRRFLLGVIALLCAAACSSPAGSKLPETAIGKDLPTPKNVSITPPAAGVPAADAAFSGIWEGKWGGRLPSRLIVERITAQDATVVYEWGDSPMFKRGWGREKATLTKPGVIHWFGAADMTFVMSRDHRSISGTYARPDGTSRITMTRVS